MISLFTQTGLEAPFDPSFDPDSNSVSAGSGSTGDASSFGDVLTAQDSSGDDLNDSSAPTSTQGSQKSHHPAPAHRDTNAKTSSALPEVAPMTPPPAPVPVPPVTADLTGGPKDPNAKESTSANTPAEPPSPTVTTTHALRALLSTTAAPVSTLRSAAATTPNTGTLPPALAATAPKAAGEHHGHGGPHATTTNAAVSNRTPAGATESRQAKLAAAQTPPDHAGNPTPGEDSQTPEDQAQRDFDNGDGTAGAKANLAVNDTVSDPKLVDASSLLKRAAAVTSAATVSATPGSNRQSGSVTALFTAGAGAATGSQASEGAEDAPAAGGMAQTFENVERLMQNVLQASDSLQTGGSEPMEMRVRLTGVAEDVTVRLQMVDNQLQVTFHTDSTGLRQALETGWKQMSAGSESRPSGLPDFSTASASPPHQGSPSDPDARQNRRESSPLPVGEETAPVPVRSALRPSPAVPNAAASTSSSGWTGWA